MRRHQYRSSAAGGQFAFFGALGKIQSMQDQNTSKYREIAETLRREILNGKYDETGIVPSEMQIARRFGVSRSTSIRVMIELQKLGLIERLRGSGTKLSEGVRNMTGSFGMIVPGWRTVEIMGPISAAITEAVREAGYDLLSNTISGADEYARAVSAFRVAENFAQQHVAGVFIEPIELLPNSYGLTMEIISAFDVARIPVVLIDRDIVPHPQRSRYDLVGIDNMRAGFLVGEHMVEKGAGRIAFFMHDNSASTIIARCRGVIAAANSAGVKMSLQDVCIADPEDAETVRRFIAKRRPRAIVCGNDLTAAQLLQTLRKLELRVPADILIAGFDDVRHSKLVVPRLTTVRQPCVEIGRTAVRVMLERLRNRDAAPCSVTLDCELVRRESTGEPLCSAAPSARSAHGSRKSSRPAE